MDIKDFSSGSYETIFGDEVKYHQYATPASANLNILFNLAMAFYVC